MANRRQRRVAELIHKELSVLLMLEAHDPRLAEVTLTDVDVTPDLLLARVHFTVLGDAAAEKVALTALNCASGFLRTELAGRVQLRLVPQLSFYVDQSAARGRRIDEILDQLRESSGAADEPSPAAE
jgi:ribosome-binding factor A